MTDFDHFEAGIEYEATGELIEDGIEAEGLPKFSDGNNVALRTEEATLCWTEDLGSNIINLDGYLHPDWSYGTGEVQLEGDRVFIPDEIEMNLVLPSDELIKGAEQRAAEDYSKVAYVLGGWVCQAKKADHVNDTSVKALRQNFRMVMESKEYDTPDDATTEVYHGGKL